jgi:hypothetical protein
MFCPWQTDVRCARKAAKNNTASVELRIEVTVDVIPRTTKMVCGQQ